MVSFRSLGSRPRGFGGQLLRQKCRGTYTSVTTKLKDDSKTHEVDHASRPHEFLLLTCHMHPVRYVEMIPTSVSDTAPPGIRINFNLNSERSKVSDWTADKHLLCTSQYCMYSMGRRRTKGGSRPTVHCSRLYNMGIKLRVSDAGCCWVDGGQPGSLCVSSIDW